MKNNNHIPAPSTRIKNKIMKPPLPKQPARKEKEENKNHYLNLYFRAGNFIEKLLMHTHIHMLTVEPKTKVCRNVN